MHISVSVVLILCIGLIILSFASLHQIAHQLQLHFGTGCAWSNTSDDTGWHQLTCAKSDKESTAVSFAGPTPSASMPGEMTSHFVLEELLLQLEQPPKSTSEWNLARFTC